MFYSFSKLSCQVMPDSNPYMYSSQNMKKTMKNNDENDEISAIFGIFRQI